MIIAFDVAYTDTQSLVGCVAFDDWQAAKPNWQHTFVFAASEPYESGQFYKRELPNLLQAIELIPFDIDVIVVDGYVWLSEDGKQGLGAYLFEALNKEIPVIGVAKNAFQNADEFAQAVYRGESKHPLYVTAAGMDLPVAAEHIQNMHGEFRFPTLLKLVDQLSRKHT